VLRDRAHEREKLTTSISLCSYPPNYHDKDQNEVITARVQMWASNYHNIGAATPHTLGTLGWPKWA